jgi:3',5'-cyclic AMP phosphodiesterase CpdA
MVADVQYSDREPKRARFYRGAIEKLREAMACFRTNRVDFVMELGDIIDRDYASYATVLPEFRGAGVREQHLVLGNHEWKVAAADRSRVLSVLGLTARYYCLGLDRWRLVVMDGTELSRYATREGSPARSTADAMLRKLQSDGAMNAMAYNGGVTPQQLDWLHQELASAQAAGDRVIVLSHFPIHPPQATHNLWNDGEVQAALEQYPGVAVAHLNGHDHAGGYWQHAGIHYLTLHAMVETMEQNAFALLRLYPDRIEVVGHGRQPSYTLRPIGVDSHRWQHEQSAGSDRR